MDWFPNHQFLLIGYPVNYQESKYSYIFVGSKIRIFIEIERKNGPYIEIYNIFCWRMNFSKYRPEGEESAKENYSIIMDLTAHQIYLIKSV